jgi:hypothetical protein
VNRKLWLKEREREIFDRSISFGLKARLENSFYEEKNICMVYTSNMTTAALFDHTF